MICRHCQQDNDDEARFCTRCGRPQLSHDVSLQPAVLEEAFDVAALARLREEKHRLSQQLNAMLVRAERRAFTAEEERAWHQLYDRWKTASDELTARMDYLSSREERDRRQRERREAQRRKHYFAIEVDERRDGRDRRRKERREGPDRRTPFPEAPPGDTP